LFFWLVVALVTFVIITLRVSRAVRWIDRAMKPLDPIVKGLGVVLVGIRTDLNEAQREFTSDDGLRVVMGVFMVWLANSLLHNPDLGTAGYMAERGWDINWLILTLAGCGVALATKRWDARWLFAFTTPLLIYAVHTLVYTVEQDLTPIPSSFQMLVWVIMMLHTLRISNRQKVE
jgi:cell division protein FtsW (lipid II flippase)